MVAVRIPPTFGYTNQRALWGDYATADPVCKQSRLRLIICAHQHADRHHQTLLRCKIELKNLNVKLIKTRLFGSPNWGHGERARSNTPSPSQVTLGKRDPMKLKKYTLRTTWYGCSLDGLTHLFCMQPAGLLLVKSHSRRKIMDAREFEDTITCVSPVSAFRLVDYWLPLFLAM